MQAASGLSYREIAESIKNETGIEVNHVWVSRAIARVRKRTAPQAKGNQTGRHPTNFRPDAPDDGVVATEIVRVDENEARRKAFLDNCIGLGDDTIAMLRALARMLTRAAENNKNPQLLEGLTEVVADRTIRVLSVVMPLVNPDADQAAISTEDQP